MQRSAIDAVLGLAVSAALACFLCPRQELAAVMLGLGLAWLAATVGVVVLAALQNVSFRALFAAFWGGLGLRALIFMALTVVCFARPNSRAAFTLVAYALGTAAALVFLESRWVLRTRS